MTIFNNFTQAQSNVHSLTSKTNTIKLPNDSVMVSKAIHGDPDAQAYIGMCYYLGESGVEENDKEAIMWLKKSVVKGSPYGMYWLGLSYSNGYGGNSNIEKGSALIKSAIEQFRKLSEKNDPNAQYHLGLCYRDGNATGGEEDYKSALFWFEKAGELGHEEAQCEAAEMYGKLYGSKCKGRFDWYKTAAEQNNPRGLYELAQYYISGLGVKKSFEEAAKLCLRSAENGYGLAQLSIAEYYEEGKGVKKNLDEAIKWYKEAAKNNIYGALYNLGCYYRDGYGVDRDYDVAVKYMKQAAKHDSEDAIFDLKELQRKGRIYYQKLPKRCLENFYELTPGDPFNDAVLSDNWNELDEDTKKIYRKQFKKEKIREWGEDIATKVVQHIVEIGFTSEQVRYSQGFNYQVHNISVPNSTIIIMKYPHCTYYLLNDKLFGMVWSNGMQVGDIKLIEKYSGDIIITEGNH